MLSIRLNSRLRSRYPAVDPGIQPVWIDCRHRSIPSRFLICSIRHIDDGCLASRCRLAVGIPVEHQISKGRKVIERRCRGVRGICLLSGRNHCSARVVWTTVSARAGAGHRCVCCSVVTVTGIAATRTAGTLVAAPHTGDQGSADDGEDGPLHRRVLG